jgi:hypothetical protein
MTGLAEVLYGPPPAFTAPPGPVRFPYLMSDRRIQGKFEPSPEPTVPVTLVGPENWSKTVALLDTGADRSVVPDSWAEILRVDLDNARSQWAWAMGVGVEFRRPADPLRLELAGTWFDFHPVFGPWDSLVLGRDVFRHFRVMFDERAGEVTLDPYEAAA